ncbi:cupin domain-containing protein [Gilvibacter sediminis]|uniref:cupin domain-containing protein n=1 Tax=Gilvibacter sediminis TaxID=379071 RepID=UPI002350B367|nr:cupin domain-containing protein [Gilvibacter sediminis]MDC7998948.1 cupin domain-containing protein [Gilvibacter sediminis]
MKNTLEELITKLDLKPHPEGGYYKETYRSTGTISASNLPAEYAGERNFSTSIYFLLTSENFSSFHRINQDEIWHFYDGSPLLLHIITPEGAYSKHRIGIDLSKGEVPQYVVPGGCWFAAEVMAPDSFSFIGCTVSPGFSFADFQLANRSDLTHQFPQHAAAVERLTRE